MDAFIARPEGNDRHPGLLVFQEAFGVNSHIRDVTERFAREGYIAIAPELFHRTAPGFEGNYDDIAPVMAHMKALTDEGLRADIEAAYNRLRDDSAARADSIASVGYCMGGRVSFLANASIPLRVAISYYGGGIAPSKLPDGATTPGLLNRASDLRGPMLLFWGGLDKHIPPDQVRAVTDSLTEAGKNYVNVEFSQADHGFFCDQRGSYDPDAARQSWVLTLEFLKTHL